MRAIDRYVLREYARALGFAVAALAGIFWLSQAIKLIDTILLRGGGTGAFFRLSVYLLPEVLVSVTPIAMLIAMLFAMNRMAQDAELLVPVASGRNPMDNLRPALFAGLGMAVLVALVSLWLLPNSRFAIKAEIFTIGENFNRNVITPKEFVGPIKGLVVYADESELSGEMLNVFISDQRNPETFREYYADRALLARDGPERNLALINGQAHERDPKTGAISVASFDRFEISLGPTISGEDVTSNKVDRASSLDLLALWRTRKDVNNEAFAELTQRLAVPILALSMPVIGALAFVLMPYSRAGHRRDIAIAIIFGIALQGIVIGAKSTIIADPIAGLVIFLPPIATYFAFLLLRRRAEAGQ